MKRQYRLDFLELGLTDFCQNRCIMCHQSKGWFEQLPRHFIDTELVLRLFRELAAEDFQIHSLYLFWAGEPLLHPEFSRILRAAFATQPPIFKGFTLNSNAIGLDMEKRQAICNVSQQAEFAQFIISLDSLRPATYARIRVGGDHGAALHNFRAMLAERNAGRPVLIPQMVVMPENLGEIDEFVEGIQALGREYGTDFPVTGSREDFHRDCLYLRPLLFDESWLPDGEAARRWREAWQIWREALRRHGASTDEEAALIRESADPRRDQNGVCASIFRGAVISSSGLVLPCCGDYACELVCGDLQRQSFLSAWLSPQFQQLRRCLVEDPRRSHPPRCQRCHLPAETRISREEGRKYLQTMVYLQHELFGKDSPRPCAPST